MQLADWYRAFVSGGQGEHPCKDPKKGATGGSVEATGGRVSGPTLEGSLGRGSAANADDSESDRGQAASTTSGSEGGAV